MKTKFSLALILCLSFFIMNAQLIDDFADGDFNTNPIWVGSTDAFIINADFQLQLDDDAAGQNYLSVNQSETDLSAKEWRFYIKQSFSPSVNNNSRVYLSSNTPTLSYSGNDGAGVNGYFLLFGENGSDDAIRLFKDNAGTLDTEELGSGTIGFVSSSFEITVKIVRDALGNWSIYSDENAGEDYQLQFTAFDNEYTSTNNMGVSCKYTISNSDDFFFDDFYYGSVIVDEAPPTIIASEIISDTEIDLLFSEPVNLDVAENVSNYNLAGIGNPTTAIVDLDNPALIHLTFSTSFIEDDLMTLSIENIEDLSGNIMILTSIELTYIIPTLGEYRQIVFSEIMADPTPVVNLPEVEYVELKNISEESFDLANWTFVNTTTPKILSSFILEPGALVILCDEEDASLLDPFGDVIAINSFTALANTGDSLTLINAEGTIIDIVSYNNDWYGDSSLDDGGYSLVNTLYTSTAPWSEVTWLASTSIDGGTPGQDNLEVTLPDTIPPILLSNILISGTEVDLLFSEPLGNSTSENTSNYNLSLIGNPIVTTLDSENSSLVHLVFSTEFPEDELMTLTIENIEDLAGNILVSTEVDLTYIIPTVATYRQVVFSEIMADPNPVINLPEIEYVELKNTSNETFNLMGWTFVNTTTEKTLTNYILSPGGLLILCDENDVDELTSFGDVLGISSFSALANTADSLTLLNNEGLIIDVVSYTNEWYGNSELDDGGYSFVNTSYNSFCPWTEETWKASTSPNGGTPGQDNIEIIIPDNTAPELLGITLISLVEIKAVFNEILDESTIQASNFSMTGGISIESAMIDPLDLTAAILTVDIPINYGIEYNLTVTNVADCEGDQMNSPFSFDFIIGFLPEAGDIFINEIMADPNTDFPSPNAEFIELYNNSDKLLELNGISVSNGFISGNFLFEPDTYVILTKTGNEDSFDESTTVLYLENMPTLTNSGKELELLDRDENVLEIVTYSLSWYHDNSKDDGGYSLERINKNDPCSDSDNWRASEDLSGSTEGLINSVNNIEDDTTPPVALYTLTWNANSVEVIFNEQISGFSLQNASLEFYSTHLDLIVLPLDTIYYLSTANTNSIFVLFNSPIDTSLIWTMNLHGVEDCWGNAMESQEIQFATAGFYETNDVIINEVLFNPRENGEDYIELYNNSEHNINLNEWFLANVNDGEIDNYKLITDQPRILFKHNYLVLSKSKEGILTNYPFAKEENILIMESLPTYSTSDGTVVLINSNEEVADSMTYNEDMHFSLLSEEKGVSLERLSFDRESIDKSNWYSAAESQNFGTPGYINSQQMDEIEGNNLLELSSEVFSPDNDGYQDVITFQVKLDKPGFLLNLQVIDQKGVVVKNILTNHLAGNTTAISWDGIDENLHLSPMGIYLVMLEYFDLEGNVNYEKTTCVLAHRLN